MISTLLAKLYGIILENKIIIWLESEGKRVLEDNTQQQTTSLCLGSLWRNVVMINTISFFFFVDFRKDFDTVPRNNLWNRLEYLKVPFDLRDAAIRL